MYILHSTFYLGQNKWGEINWRRYKTILFNNIEAVDRKLKKISEKYLNVQKELFQLKRGKRN